MSTQSAPFELHFFHTPNGQKISVMLEELGAPYVVRPVHIGRGEQFRPEYLAIAPTNKIPALVDPEGPGGAPISIFESGAILQYLGRKFRRFYPEEERARVEVEQWLFWQMSALGPMAGQANHFLEYARERVPYAIERYSKEVTHLYSLLNRRLDGREFVAGDFSIADIACIGWIHAHAVHRQNLGDYPALGAWYERMVARPGVARGLAVRA